MDVCLEWTVTLTFPETQMQNKNGQLELLVRFLLFSIQGCRVQIAPSFFCLYLFR